MPRVETATINHARLAEVLRERQLKQWWVARQIGVTPLTVNRWLTGKVRRISADNLQRLAALLECNERSLTLGEDSEVHATQVEQSQAARLLVAPQSQDMFVKAGQLETYERLIKAVMHPNLPLATLLEIYSMLTLISGLQGDFERSLKYARLKLGIAQRCGDAGKALEARINLASGEGALGNLAASHRGLLDLFSDAESQGALRSMVTARMNLIATYHLQRSMNDAARSASGALEQLAAFSPEDADQQHWKRLARCYVLFGVCSVVLECGQFGLLDAILAELVPQAAEVLTPLERQTLELMALVRDSLLGRELELRGFTELADEYAKASQYSLGGSILPAVIYRRAGRFTEAEHYLAGLEQHPGCQLYEKVSIAEEHARLHAARGQDALAAGWDERARELRQQFGIPSRPGDQLDTELSLRYRLSRRACLELLAAVEALRDWA